MEQIDQLNVFLLQDIDEKFSNFHQVITTRLIPAVKKFNAVSEPTREAAKVRTCARPSQMLGRAPDERTQ